MNLFEVLNRGDSRLKEPSISAMTGFLLDTKETHGIGDLFLRELLGRFGYPYLDFLERNQHTEVELESKYKLNNVERWVDIEVRLLDAQKKEILRILIENKIKETSANPQQLADYYEALKFEEPDLENLLILFIVPRTDSPKIQTEFQNLVLQHPNHRKEMIAWVQDPSITQILRNILQKESTAQIPPLNDYFKHTLKAFIIFLETLMNPVKKSVQPQDLGNVVDEVQIVLDDNTYKLEKYESKTVLGYINEEKVVAKDVMRFLIRHFNLPYDEVTITKNRTTRSLGHELIKKLKEISQS